MKVSELTSDQLPSTLATAMKVKNKGSKEQSF